MFVCLFVFLKQKVKKSILKTRWGEKDGSEEESFK